VAVEDAGVLVSAAHNSRTEDQVRDILDAARLTDGARPARLARSARAAAAPIVAPGTLTDNAFDTCTAQSQSSFTTAWNRPG